MKNTTCTIYNQTRNVKLAENAVMAASYLKRLKGLLGRKSLEQGEGLILMPCNSVHCMGMRFSIDVLFISKDNIILELYPEMKPYQVSRMVFGAHYAIELPAGSIKKNRYLHWRPG